MIKGIKLSDLDEIYKAIQRRYNTLYDCDCNYCDHIKFNASHIDVAIEHNSQYNEDLKYSEYVVGIDFVIDYKSEDDLIEYFNSVVKKIIDKKNIGTIYYLPVTVVQFVINPNVFIEFVERYQHNPTVDADNNLNITIDYTISIILTRDTQTNDVVYLEDIQNSELKEYMFYQFDTTVKRKFDIVQTLTQSADKIAIIKGNKEK